MHYPKVAWLEVILMSVIQPNTHSVGLLFTFSQLYIYVRLILMSTYKKCTQINTKGFM